MALWGEEAVSYTHLDVYKRQAIRTALSSATSYGEFAAVLLQQGVTVKESRGRLSYLTPDRTKPITARKLGDDFDRAAVLALLEQNAHRAAEQTATVPEYPRNIRERLQGKKAVQTTPEKDGIPVSYTHLALVCGYTGLLHQYSDCGGVFCPLFTSTTVKRGRFGKRSGICFVFPVCSLQQSGSVVCQRFLKMGAKKAVNLFKIYCLSAAVMGGGIKSVSYTHLDVYKRQLFCIKWSSNTKMLLLHFHAP